MCDPNEQDPIQSLARSVLPPPAADVVAPPGIAASALLGLMGLRDALVAFKGPLADDPEFRRVIERLLFGNETRERILGIPDKERGLDYLPGQSPII